MIVEYIRYQAPDEGTAARLLKGYRDAGSSLQAARALPRVVN